MKKKEIFILLPLILISSLIIYFINPKQSDNSQEIKEQNIKIEYSQNNKNKALGLFRKIEDMRLNDTINIIPDILSNINEDKEPIESESEQKKDEQSSEKNIKQDEQSISDILAEVEKLSLELELELENARGAPGCSVSQDFDQESEYCKSACAQREEILKKVKNNILLFFDPCAACGPCICLCHCCGPICCI